MIPIDALHPLNHFDVHRAVSCLPKAVVAVLKNNPGVFLAGGYIRAIVAGEEANDIDLFVQNVEQAKRVVEQICAWEKGPQIRRVYSDNATTLLGYRTPIQIIHRWTFNSPQACVQSFDFTIACAAIWWQDSDPNGLWESGCDAAFYEDLAAKRLVYRSPVRNEDAGGSMIRLLKFYQKGYRAPLSTVGAVIARLTAGIDPAGLQAMVVRGMTTEQATAKILTGLLFEVDPLLDPDGILKPTCLPDPSTTEEPKEENHAVAS